jgi:hypothetical protein
MDYPVIADILRFVTLRAPQNIEHEKDIVNFIRDYRIQDTYLPVESHEFSQDENKFINSTTAQFIFNRVKDKLPGVLSNQDLLIQNRDIADEVKNWFPLKERTPIWIDEFVDVIRIHMANFNKKQLRDDLDAVVRKHFSSYTGINDYIKKIVQAKGDGEHLEAGASQFCIDFDQLFDQLYVLYVCKRKYPLNLEYTLDGLRALHIIRFLNIESNRLEQEQLWLRGCLLAWLVFIRRLNIKINLSSGMTKDNSDKSHTQCAESKLTNNGRFPIPKVSLESKEDLANLFGATPSIHKMFSYLVGYYKPFNDLHPIGIGDLLVVRQFLNKYEAGEISHIENMLKGESKDHSYRTLDRSETTYTTQMEQTEQTQKELQTTSRYELQTEVASTMQSDLSAQLNTSVSGTYGMVSFSANAGVSYHTSKTDSSRTACNFSKDVVDRSVSNIQKRVSEERISKKIFETEEIDKHDFDNSKGSGNIAGIYRWLNKRYTAQVYNYGKRLMFEFVIPEPAAFMKAVVERNKKMMSPPEPPIMPTAPKIPSGGITQDVIDQYAIQYDVDFSGLDLWPGESIPITVGCNLTPQNNNAKEFSESIKDGYKVVSATIDGEGLAGQNINAKAYLAVTVAGQCQEFPAEYDTDRGIWKIVLDSTMTFTIPAERTLIVEVFGAGVEMYSFMVQAWAIPLKSTKMAWQNKALGLIINGYNSKMQEFNSAQTDYEAKLEAYNASLNALAQGFNPLINAEIIKTELKKYCLSMITKQFASDRYQKDDINFSAMLSRSTGFDKAGNLVPLAEELPAVDVDTARNKGVLIEFLEQAFEWPQITYLLYPYIWGHMPKWWFEAQGYFNEVDPLYSKFLQAGSVRVLLAVHPAYETAVMHYLYTQEVWNGGEAPTINDPMYIPIYAELHNQQDDLTGAVPYGDPWDVVVPTSLIYLQPTSELPVFNSGSTSS